MGKGEEVAADDGMLTRISRPLDFMMVADHAEYLGLVPGLARKDPILMKDKEGARWAKMIEEGKLAEGYGVSASRATTAEEFYEQFSAAMKKKGPHLIDAHVESIAPIAIRMIRENLVL